MKKIDPIAKTLDLEPYVPDVVDTVPYDQIDDDYEYARKNIIDVISKGQEALDNIADVAQQSESARAYEVTTNLIKTLVDANKDLLELAKKKKELKGPGSNNEPGKVVNNNMYVGSTAELLKMIKAQND
jgi:hypothetical protein